jgi:MFS family permease
MASLTTGRQLPVILALGTTQTLAWASSYYLPAILADPIARDLGLSSNWIFAAFSAALVISGLLGPHIGRQIDLIGGRALLSASNVILASGLVLLGVSQSIVLLAVAWLVLGVGMGLGLYDAAFGALGRIYGHSARRAITGITLLAGFASTIGWPLTHSDGRKPAIPMDRTMVLLALAFALAWTVTAAMAVHLPRILEAAGATSVQAIAAGALIGPAQVAARIAEAGLLSRYHPLISARLACLTHPLGAAVLAMASGGAFGAFAILHGAGNGILTIARGTLPLAIFGPVNYAYRLGLLGAPARLSQAMAPLLFGLMIDYLGERVLIVSSLLSLSAFAALYFIPKATHVPAE